MKLRSSQPTTLLQVLLFAEEGSLRDYGRAVWAAFEEVAAFYRRAVPTLPCHRVVYVSDGTVTDVVREEWSEEPEVAPGVRSMLWQSFKGRTPGVFKQQEMISKIRSVLGPRWSDAHVLVCTDQPIRPPEDWRYILWDFVENDVVVSTAAMDPSYWGERTPDRVSTIKHRMRTAALSATGCQLGLNRCSNSSCLLYRDVTSVACLDSMLLLGPEHGVSSLEGFGFAPRPKDPSRPQEILPMRDFQGGECA